MNQTNGNTRGIEGLLNGKASLDAQIEASLGAANQAMEMLRVAMAFKNDLDSAVAKFQKGMAGIGQAQKDGSSLVPQDDEDQSVDEIVAEYEKRKSRLTI